MSLSNDSSQILEGLPSFHLHEFGIAPDSCRQYTLHPLAAEAQPIAGEVCDRDAGKAVCHHKIINRIIICINPHKIAYLYLNLPLRTIYGIFFEPYAGGIYSL